MKVSRRSRMAGAATAAVVALGGGGFAAGTIMTEPGQAASAPAAPGPGYADVVSRVLPSVVLIRTAEGLGSGVILDNKGDIVTNAHVAGNATSFQVQLADDTRLRQAQLVGSYPAGDLAVIRVDDQTGLKPASFGDSDKARSGDAVLAVGNPLGLSGSVTDGIISATGRAVSEPASPNSPGTVLPDAVQTSAPINPGNSGGALVNASGQVIGIPTLAAASSGGGSQAQGIGFAIPSNLAKDIAAQLISTGHVTSTHRAALGAQVTTITNQGAGIVSVTPGGAAARDGLHAGDVIQAAGQVPVADTTALSAALAAKDPGQTITLTIARDARTLDVRVTLGELSADQ